MYIVILQIMAVIYFIVGTKNRTDNGNTLVGCSFAIIGGINIYNNLWIIGIFFILLSFIGLTIPFYKGHKGEDTKNVDE